MISNEIHYESMVVSGVTIIIHLLPLTWNEFKNYLKHNQKEMNLE